MEASRELLDINQIEINTLLQDLQRAINDYDSDALSLIKQLQQVKNLQPLKSEFDTLALTLDNFDFNKAELLLADLVESLSFN
ncbi:hypothetical protein [Candidatus Colwellia aromaticivorans]|uniref:hypothetical protein n=1 Tax=Candidatus Colwellia aromaticivorans TaxID=2267621 RepID=UPI00109BEE04|nr:hypothetical protein [Candidatus Colwellia aromaticivorans]